MKTFAVAVFLANCRINYVDTSLADHNPPAAASRDTTGRLADAEEDDVVRQAGSEG